jgi:hypothetical protein
MFEQSVNSFFPRGISKREDIYNEIFIRDATKPVPWLEYFFLLHDSPLHL